MFQAKTLLVLGAGASVDMSFPVGDALIKVIRRRLSLDHSTSSLSDKDIHQALLVHVGQTRPDSPHQYSLRDYLEAAEQISLAMPLSASIDTYMDDHRTDPRIQLCGRLGIVKSILESEAVSRRLFSVDGHLDRTNTDELTSTWLARFFKILRGGISKDEIFSIFDAISIISFNYDRSLEYFLVEMLRIYYNIPEDEAQRVLQKLMIVHPYGTVGPWHEGNDHQPFGEAVYSPQNLLRLAQRIQTYTQSSAHAEDVRRMVSEAETVVFLGFGYIRENLRLLAPHKDTRSTQQIYGTAHGFSEPNKTVITNILGPFISQPLRPREGAAAAPPIALFRGTCAEFFEEYSYALARQ
jgi:hypothetical protein